MLSSMTYLLEYSNEIFVLFEFSGITLFYNRIGNLAF